MNEALPQLSADAIQSSSLKLNIGSGRTRIDGYVNVDVQAIGDVKPDIFADARKIPLPNGCAQEVMAIHVFEHFYRWEVEDILREWARLLRSGGLLVLEMPDIVLCAKNIVNDLQGRKHPEQLGMWGVYGDPRDKDPYMMHKWGWTYVTLRPELEAAGFYKVLPKPTEFHSIGRNIRDMRVEALKK